MDRPLSRADIASSPCADSGLLCHTERSEESWPLPPLAFLALLVGEVFMIEQEKVNRAKIWGYATGAVIFALVLAAKFVIR
jgi:hypothetical protein